MPSLYFVIGPALKKIVSDLIDTPDEQLIQSYRQNNDARAFNALFAKYFGLIVKIAKPFYKKQKTKDLDHFVDLAVIGFFDAVKEHNINGTDRFIPYAIIRIRYAILGAYRSEMNKSFSRERWGAYKSLRNAINNLLCRIFDNSNELIDAETLATELWGYAERIKIDKVNDLVGDIFVALKEEIDNETAFKLNMALAKIDSAVDEVRHLKIEIPLDINVNDIVEDPAPPAIEKYLEEETKHAIRVEILNLPQEESLVMILFYDVGLLGKEIAEIMCVTEPRVNQIKVKALIRLVKRLRNKKAVE